MDANPAPVHHWRVFCKPITMSLSLRRLLQTARERVPQYRDLICCQPINRHSTPHPHLIAQITHGAHTYGLTPRALPFAALAVCFPASINVLPHRYGSNTIREKICMRRKGRILLMS